MFLANDGLIIQTNVGIIYVYNGYYAKKINIRDLFYYKKYNIKKMCWKDFAFQFYNINFICDLNYKNFTNRFDEENWYKYFLSFDVINYFASIKLSFENESFEGFEKTPEELSYAIFSVKIFNTKKSTTYTFDRKDTQMALLLLEQKNSTLELFYGIIPDQILIENTIIKPKTLNFYQFFELVIERHVNQITVFYSEESHFLLVSYPIFNEKTGTSIIKKIK